MNINAVPAYTIPECLARATHTATTRSATVHKYGHCGLTLTHRIKDQLLSRILPQTMSRSHNPFRNKQYIWPCTGGIAARSSSPSGPTPMPPTFQPSMDDSLRARVQQWQQTVQEQTGFVGDQDTSRDTSSLDSLPAHAVAGEANVPMGGSPTVISILRQANRCEPTSNPNSGNPGRRPGRSDALHRCSLCLTQFVS